MERSNTSSADKITQSSFSPEEIELIFTNIDELKDVSDIEELQKKLHSDYKLLAKEFASSRISRVDSYLSTIENLQSQLKKNFNAHQVFVTNNLPTIDPTTGVTFDSLNSLKTNKKKHFDENQLNIIGSPPPIEPRSPVLNSLPIFPGPFDALIKPYKDQLESLKKQYQYETKLLEDTTRKNVELVWRQSIKDKNEIRKNLRRKLVNEKWDLEKDYYNISRNKKIENIEQRFRISTRKIGETKKKGSDLQRIGKLVKERVENHPKVILQLTNIPMASESEISNDLEMIKNNSLDLKLSRLETSYLYIERKEPPVKIESPSTTTTYTELINDRLESTKWQMNHNPPYVQRTQGHPQLMAFQQPIYPPLQYPQHHLLPQSQFPPQRPNLYQQPFSFNQQTKPFDMSGNQLMMTNFPQGPNWAGLDSNWAKK